MRNGIDIECGDIILFSRPCLNMSIIPAVICVAAKQSSFSSYDHIGLVVEGDPDPIPNPNSNGDDKGLDNGENGVKGVLYLLEANMNGVTCRRLEERLQRTTAIHYSVRKLIGSKSEAFKTKLWEESQKIVGNGYNPSFLNMANSLVCSYLAHSQSESISQTILTRIERTMNDISATIDLLSLNNGDYNDKNHRDISHNGSNNDDNSNNNNYINNNNSSSTKNDNNNNNNSYKNECIIKLLKFRSKQLEIMKQDFLKLLNNNDDIKRK
jgi:hypothetical protein